MLDGIRQGSVMIELLKEKDYLRERIKHSERCIQDMEALGHKNLAYERGVLNEMKRTMDLFESWTGRSGSN